MSGAGVTTQVESGDWQVICMCAISILEDIVRKILTGDTSMMELREVEKRRTQLQKVCVAVSGHEEAVNMPSIKDLDACVIQRLKEFEKFCSYREELSNVLLFLSCVKLQGNKMYSNFYRNIFIIAFFYVGDEQIHYKLQANVDTCPIRELCSTDDGQVCVVHGFSDVEPLEPCLKQFWFMTQESKCDIFIKFLNERLAALVRDKCTLSMNDVMPEVWIPVFAQCEQVLEQLMDFSIPLPVVDDLFHGKDNDHIGHNIKQLQKGVEWCRSRRVVNDFGWIKRVIDCMNQFWKLSRYTDAARAFLKIRDALKLTGNFNVVENVASQVMRTYS